jgi:hypothetical protein
VCSSDLARDTKQIDETGGYNICTANRNAILNSDEVHVFWDSDSTGSLFDLGVAFSVNKKIIIVNPESIIKTEGKSFTNFIDYWSKI